MSRRLSATSLVVALAVLAAMMGVLLVTSGDSSAGQKRTFVMPHFLEKKGLTNNTNNTFDTTLFMTYGTGIQSGGAVTGASVELYLYKNNDDLLVSNDGTIVCNPCTVNLSDTKRKESYRLDDLITKRGGFPSNKTISGYGLVVVQGDADGVNFQGFVVNAHTGPFDLSVMGFQPQELASLP